MQIRIRPATPDDQATLVEFNARLAHESEGKVLDAAVLGAGVAAIFRDGDKGFYTVAEDEAAPGVVVGQCLVTLEWSDWRNGWYWWIQSVYVTAAVRRQGVFRALYRHLETEAVLRPDVIGIRLYVEHDNATARKTYAELGLEEEPYILMGRYPLPGKPNAIS